MLASWCGTIEERQWRDSVHTTGEGGQVGVSSTGMGEGRGPPVGVLSTGVGKGNTWRGLLEEGGWVGVLSTGVDEGNTWRGPPEEGGWVGVLSTGVGEGNTWRGPPEEGGWLLDRGSPRVLSVTEGFASCNSTLIIFPFLPARKENTGTFNSIGLLCKHVYIHVHVISEITCT